MAVDPQTAGRLLASDEHILALFDAPGSVETPTPGAAVWLATDPSNGKRPVLIRRLAPGMGKGRATEALTLHHPHIVRTRRWLSEGGSIYVVRDVIRGRNLRQKVASLPNGALDLDYLHTYLMPVLDALQFAHERGIAHGGICPENVLIADDGPVRVSDWGAADPRSIHHLQAYRGVATVAGDVIAAGRLLATYLPTTGTFASPMVRGRIEGVIGRCETLTQLRETLQSLDRLAAMPSGRPVGPPPMAEDLTPIVNPSATTALAPAGSPQLMRMPRLSTEMAERTPFILPGGGGSATMIVRNEGDAPLIIRMVATQHAWLNVRPVELPLTIPPGGSTRIEFSISAARLAVGEYRSEVYLSANASGQAAEDLRGGWYKHTGDIRIAIGGPPTGPPVPTPLGGNSVTSSIPYPGDAPKLPPMGGCATVIVLFGLLVSLPALASLFLHHTAAIGFALP